MTGRALTKLKPQTVFKLRLTISRGNSVAIPLRFVRSFLLGCCFVMFYAILTLFGILEGLCCMIASFFWISPYLYHQPYSVA